MNGRIERPRLYKVCFIPNRKRAESNEILDNHDMSEITSRQKRNEEEMKKKVKKNKETEKKQTKLSTNLEARMKGPEYTRNSPRHVVVEHRLSSELRFEGTIST
eukprot:TRINITY_DN3215_c0_g1_i3.p1 TRINITY_DN3215_c0_g1~~TRINITY_DN3215_c0_g1_i3.p1  ORF type:complete len:104 (-),score=14.80 TRINITY_DN3215_c0_g1_i3:139-450(-)